MAVVSSKGPQAVSQGGSSTSEEKKPQQLKKVDLNDTSLPDGEAIEIDSKADAYSFAKPAPHGIYQLKLYLDSSGFRMGQADEHDPSSVYFIADLDMRVISDDKNIQGQSIQDGLSTTVFRGHKASQVSTLISKIGYGDKIPASITPRQQATLLSKILKKEPIVFAELDWRAWSKNQLNRRTGKGGSWLLRGMEKFPQLEDGSYDHCIEDASGETCYARMFVVRFLSAEEAKGATVEVKKPVRVVSAVAGTAPVASGGVDDLSDLDSI